MLEIAPKSYLDTLVNQKLRKGEAYKWHSQKMMELALEKAKTLLLSEYNGWEIQTERLKKEVLSCVVHDRALGISDFLNRIGGNAKLFAVVDDLKRRVVSAEHDWELKPIRSHGGLVPGQVALLAAKLKDKSLSFDEYFVGEPLPKPALPQPKDPVLLGGLESPLGWYLVEVGRWSGTITESASAPYGLELKFPSKGKGIVLWMGLFIFILVLVMVLYKLVSG